VAADALVAGRSCGVMRLLLNGRCTNVIRLNIIQPGRIHDIDA
jgi:hypothetical protein